MLHFAVAVRMLVTEKGTGRVCGKIITTLFGEGEGYVQDFLKGKVSQPFWHLL